MTTETDSGTGTPAQPPTTEEHHLELPFAWEHGPDKPDLGDRDTVFRFPSADDPQPGQRRLLAMSLYASVLGLLALAVAVRGLLAIIGGTAAGWYQPTLAVAGLVCVGLVVAAFLSIHRRLLPWLLLAAATVPLAINIIATAQAA